ncbi:hypothetical protein [Streptomyces sp. NBC_01497]|uniref:hypothetical protein n=1 Tax=Streptomyces sp. NBC_01497 TaxID=2903885 RepID=UPI002E373A02|nr:hypothetical protein [Streptomyces sp. NBC_01497]
MRRMTPTATVGVAIAAALLAGSGIATADTDQVTAKPAACGINDVSFYFGGASSGIGQRSFDITLLAHDGVACTLTDIPLISVGGPPSQKTPIPLSVNGRGGSLVLRPNSPLHASVFYSAPDTAEDTIQVSSLTLAMPDHTSLSTSFLFPGTMDIYSGGVFVTAWTTGLGLGQGEEG